MQFLADCLQTEKREEKLITIKIKVSKYDLMPSMISPVYYLMLAAQCCEVKSIMHP